MNVLVTDGETRAALAVARSLGRKGHSVIIASSSDESIAASSKFCRHAIRTANPMFSIAQDYISDILNIICAKKIDFVIPITEQSISLINEQIKKIPEKVIVGCAPTIAMEAASNKYSICKLANDLQLPVPQTLFVSSAKEIACMNLSSLIYPVVVKPAYSKVRHGGKLIATKVMYANDETTLKYIYKDRIELCYPSLIQEKIIGPGIGLFTLFDRDRHLALFSHQRILEKPPTGGVSVLSKSIALDPELVKYTCVLLKRINWKGIAMVEFKRDIRDGKAKLMEINGRFWGSLQLAISSGVDFPALFVDYCQGKIPEKIVSNYKIGHQLKWSMGLFDHMLIQFKTFFDQCGPVNHFTSCGVVIKELLLNGHRSITNDVQDPEDPMPFLSELKSYFGINKNNV